MYLENYGCALCNENTEETSIHLFWNCPSTLHCWDLITPVKNISILVFDEIQNACTKLDIALDIVVMACWATWAVKNDRIFRYAPTHHQGWIHYLKEGLLTTQIRANAAKASKFKDWIDSNIVL